MKEEEKITPENEEELTPENIRISDDVELYADNSIIDLYDENDNCVQFFEVAGIAHEGKYYELLQPVEPNDMIGEDEAVIMECIVSETDEPSDFIPVADEALLNEVFGKYITAYEDYCVNVLGEERCDCEGCNHDHCHNDDCHNDDCGCGERKCDKKK